MLERFYEERAAIAAYHEEFGRVELPSEDAQRALRDLAGVLKPLAEATDLLQSDGGRCPLSTYLPVLKERERA